MSIKYEETRFGFDYGDAKVERLYSDDKTKSVTLGIKTSKHAGNKGLQVYVTKTGRVRVHDSRGKWTPPSV